MKRIERGLLILVLMGMSFFLGVFYTFYEIDQRTWSETVLKARDIETRYLNYPKKRNYKTEDIERIIYGQK
jgi:hypothetical protein